MNTGAAAFLHGSSPSASRSSVRSGPISSAAQAKVRSYWYSNEAAVLAGSTLSPRRPAKPSEEGAEIRLYRSNFDAISRALHQGDETAGENGENSVPAAAPLAPVHEIVAASFVSCSLNASQVLLLPIFARLKLLDLSDNPLSGLGEDGGSDSPFWLAMAPELEILVLRGCQLKSIPPLLGAKKLRALDLSCNAIKSVDNLEPAITTLKALDLGYNDISTVFALRPLALLAELRSLRLHPNPVTLMPSTVTACYASLRSMLPQVANLDGRENYSGGSAMAAAFAADNNGNNGNDNSDGNSNSNGDSSRAAGYTSARRRRQRSTSRGATASSARKNAAAASPRSIPFVVPPPPPPPPMPTPSHAHTDSSLRSDNNDRDRDSTFVDGDLRDSATTDDEQQQQHQHQQQQYYRDARTQRFHMELLARPRPKVPELVGEMSPLNQWNGSVISRRKSEVSGRKLVAISPTRWAIVNSNGFVETTTGAGGGGVPSVPHNYHVHRPLPMSPSTSSASAGAAAAVMAAMSASMPVPMPTPLPPASPPRIAGIGAGGGGGVVVSAPAQPVSSQPAIPFVPPQGPGFGSSSPRNLFPQETKAVTVETSFEQEQQHRRAIMAAPKGASPRSRSAGPTPSKAGGAAATATAAAMTPGPSSSGWQPRSLSNGRASSSSPNGGGGGGGVDAYQQALAMQHLPADHSFVMQVSGSTNAANPNAAGMAAAVGGAGSHSSSRRSTSQFSSYTDAALKGAGREDASTAPSAIDTDDGELGGNAGARGGVAVAGDFRPLPPPSPGSPQPIVGPNHSPTPLQPRSPLPLAPSQHQQHHHHHHVASAATADGVSVASASSVPSFVNNSASLQQQASAHFNRHHYEQQQQQQSPFFNSGSAAAARARAASPLATGQRQGQAQGQHHGRSRSPHHQSPLALGAMPAPAPGSVASRFSLTSMGSGGAGPFSQHSSPQLRPQLHNHRSGNPQAVSLAASSSAPSSPPVLGSAHHPVPLPSAPSPLPPSAVSSSAAAAALPPPPPPEELVEAWLQLAKLRTLTLLSAYNRLSSLLETASAAASSGAGAGAAKKEQLRLGLQGIVTQLQSVSLLPQGFLPSAASASSVVEEHYCSRLRAGSSRAMVAVAREIGIPSVDVLSPKALMAVVAAEEQHSAASSATEGLALLLWELSSAVTAMATATATTTTEAEAQGRITAVRSSIERLKVAVASSSVGRFVGANAASSPAAVARGSPSPAPSSPSS